MQCPLCERSCPHLGNYFQDLRPSRSWALGFKVCSALMFDTLVLVCFAKTMKKTKGFSAKCHHVLAWYVSATLHQVPSSIRGTLKADHDMGCQYPGLHIPTHISYAESTCETPLPPPESFKQWLTPFCILAVCFGRWGSLLWPHGRPKAPPSSDKGLGT